LSSKVLFKLGSGSGSGLSKNAGSGSVINQSGSTTLVRIAVISSIYYIYTYWIPVSRSDWLICLIFYTCRRKEERRGWGSSPGIVRQRWRRRRQGRLEFWTTISVIYFRCWSNFLAGKQRRSRRSTETTGRSCGFQRWWRTNKVIKNKEKKVDIGLPPYQGKATGIE
jgi:hypothetical protein